eukprot:5410-Heterococcus_DN1.PRE.1
MVTCTREAVSVTGSYERGLQVGLYSALYCRSLCRSECSSNGGPPDHWRHCIEALGRASRRTCEEKKINRDVVPLRSLQPLWKLSTACSSSTAALMREGA